MSSLSETQLLFGEYIDGIGIGIGGGKKIVGCEIYGFKFVGGWKRAAIEEGIQYGNLENIGHQMSQEMDN